jgi:hypothetical protein
MTAPTPRVLAELRELQAKLDQGFKRAIASCAALPPGWRANNRFAHRDVDAALDACNTSPAFVIVGST